MNAKDTPYRLLHQNTYASFSGASNASNASHCCYVNYYRRTSTFLHNKSHYIQMILHFKFNFANVFLRMARNIEGTPIKYSRL